jgi:hypothetical protein
MPNPIAEEEKDCYEFNSINRINIFSGGDDPGSHRERR